MLIYLHKVTISDPSDLLLISFCSVTPSSPAAHCALPLAIPAWAILLQLCVTSNTCSNPQVCWQGKGGGKLLVLVAPLLGFARWL